LNRRGSIHLIALTATFNRMHEGECDPVGWDSGNGKSINNPKFFSK
jgi:hypothetical protein